MSRISRIALMIGIMALCSSGTAYANTSINCYETVKEEAEYKEINSLSDSLNVNESEYTITIGDSIHEIEIYKYSLEMFTCNCGYNAFKYPVIYKGGKYLISLDDLNDIFGYSDNHMDKIDNSRTKFVNDNTLLDSTGDFKKVLEHFVCDTNIGMNGAVLSDERLKFVINQCKEYLSEVEDIDTLVKDKGLLELSEMRVNFVNKAINIYEKFNEYTNEELEQICVVRDQYIKEMNSYLDQLESVFNKEHH